MNPGLHKKKTCFVIVGPTASGKTALAIQLALKFKTEIISADARQCFRELNIGVAKPAPSQLALVHHHFIDSHSIHDDMNAGIFERYALKAVSHIFEQHDHAVMAGGTGLYIKAFAEGMDEMLSVPPVVRLQVKQGYEEFGLAWLQDRVKENDPDYFASGEIQNPQRLMRSLEVWLATGRSIRSFQLGRQQERPFDVVKIGIERPRAELYRAINQRVDEMIAAGLLHESEVLLPYRHLNALNTVGYKEMFSYLDGAISFDQAISEIKKNTRHYAKRQLTWFKRDAEVKWMEGGSL